MNSPLTAAIVVSVMLLSKLTHATVLLICVWEMSTDTGCSDRVLRFCVVSPVHPAICQDGTFKCATAASVRFFTTSPKLVIPHPTDSIAK